MELKNFTRNVIRVTAPIGGHVIRFESGEQRSVPEHLEEAAIRAGLVPLDDIKSEAQRVAELEAAEKEKAKAEAEAEAKAAAAQSEALEDAAKKAKSEAAKKAAATRAAKKAAATRAANKATAKETESN